MPVQLADAGVRVVEADLAEPQVELLADLDRARGGELLDRALLEHAQVVERHVGGADEEEAALGDLLELLQTRGVGPDEQRGDLGVELDLEGLRTRARA